MAARLAFLLFMAAGGEALVVGPVRAVRAGRMFARCLLMQDAPSTTSSTPVATEDALKILTKAAETKDQDSHAVIDALIGLEKVMRAEAKADPALSKATLDALDGAWRLVFTTGTVATQKKVR